MHCSSPATAHRSCVRDNAPHEADPGIVTPQNLDKICDLWKARVLQCFLMQRFGEKTAFASGTSRSSTWPSADLANLQSRRAPSIAPYATTASPGLGGSKHPFLSALLVTGIVDSFGFCLESQPCLSSRLPGIFDDSNFGLYSVSPQHQFRGNLSAESIRSSHIA